MFAFSVQHLVCSRLDLDDMFAFGVQLNRLRQMSMIQNCNLKRKVRCIEVLTGSEFNSNLSPWGTGGAWLAVVTSTVE